MPEVAIIGVTLSGNKGAASMLQSGVENISRLVENSRFNVLSIYPEEDRKSNRDRCVKIVPAKPLALLIAVPLAFLWWVLVRLHLPPSILRRNRILATLERSDLLIDMGGISFSDGRGVVLAYNAACILPALLLGKPVMKYAQAMGPFRTLLNRQVAKVLLPRLAVIAARGETTRGYLQELGLTNVVLCADAAFALDADDTVALETSQAIQAWDLFEGKKLVGIAASSVVRAYCQRRDIDYCQIVADFADQITTSGNYGVSLIAHAVRQSKKGGRTSDVDTCLTIYERMKNKQHCQLVIEDLPPSILRAIIGHCDYFIASRFHAMVSALAKGVPTLVTAWSHKYREVLAMFDMEEWTIGYQALTTASLLGRFETLVRHEDEVRTRIARHLPDVMRSSRQNARLTASLLGVSLPNAAQENEPNG
jgi:colanic acid/amylovoran biosynthesis protein